MNIEQQREGCAPHGLIHCTKCREADHLASLRAENGRLRGELDRQGRGEPVAYLRKDQLQQIKQRGSMYGEIGAQPRADLVAVFATPQPAEPVKEVGDAVSFDAKALAIPGGMLAFDDGSLLVRADGSGYIAVPEDQFTLYDDQCEGPDGPQGSACWIAELPTSEIVALRDFLNGQPAQPADIVKTISDEDQSLTAQQDADKAEARPIGDFWEWLGRAYGTRPTAYTAWNMEVAYAAGKQSAQPYPAMAGDDRAAFEAWIRGEFPHCSLKKGGGFYFSSLTVSYWNVWHGAVEHLRNVNHKRVQPANGEDAK